MDEYYCTNCNAILNEQFGFDPDGGSWSCTTCGQELFGDDVYDGDIYPDVMWYCDSCGALLNKQDGFGDYYSSWICTDCYHINPISEDAIIGNPSGVYYNNDYGYVHNNDGDSVSDDIFPDIIDTYFEARQQKRQEEQHLEEKRQQEQHEDRKQKNKRIRAFLFNKKRISIGISSYDLIGHDVGLAISHFKNAGFTKVQFFPVRDIFADNKKQVGEVEQVNIDGTTYFQKDSMIAYDAKIVITFHEKGEISFPVSSKQVKNMNVQVIAQQLQVLGYTNIKTVSLNDLVTGWMKNDGAVKQITVNGETSFKQGKLYLFDTAIIVTYHSFKKGVQNN